MEKIPPAEEKKADGAEQQGKENPLSSEQARERIERPIKLPREFEKVFGKEIEKEFVEIFSSPLLKEIDLLRLTGTLTLRELSDYLAVSSEFTELMSRISDLVDAVGERLRPKASYYIEQSLGRYVEGKPFDPQNNRIFKVMTLFEGATRALWVPGTYRAAIGRALEESLVTLFADSLLEQSRNTRYADPVADLLMGYEDAWWNESFVPNAIKENLVSLEYGRQVFEEWGKSGPWEHEARTLSEIRQQSEQLALEIAELSYLRDPLIGAFEEGGYKIRVLLVQADAHQFGRVLFTGNVDVVPLTHEEGRHLAGRLERGSGKISTVSASMPLSYVVGELPYESMRNAVLKTVLDGLRSRPDDYSWLPLRKRVEPEVPPSSQHVAIESAEADSAERAEWRKEAKEEALRYAEAQKAKKKEEGMLGSEIEETEEETIDANVEALRTLRGASSTEIIGALSKILGHPLRQTGSHVIFNGRTNVSFPIPDHGKRSVAFGILRRACTVLGVLPTEIRAAL